MFGGILTKYIIRVSFAIAVFVILSAVAFPALASGAGTGEYLFSETDLGVVITGYSDKNVKELTIPETIQNLPVIGVAPGAFADLNFLAGFKVSEDHKYLSAIDGVLYKKEPEMTLTAFAPCYPVYDFLVPDGTVAIGEYAFMNSHYVNLVFAPESVRKIGSFAFYKSQSLWNFICLSKEVEVGESIFAECKQEVNPYINGTFKYSLVNNEAIITGFSDELPSELHLPSVLNFHPVVGIKENAFKECKIISSLVIPDGVTYIGESAFEACDNLKSVTIPASLESIGAKAFSSCKGMITVTIPDGVTSIGAGAFSGCGSLKAVTLPESIGKIEDSMFADCISLESIALPKKIESIGASAFANCCSLKAVSIPESVTYIGEYAFKYCNNLHTLDIPESVEFIGRGALNASIPEGISVAAGNPAYELRDGALYEKNKSVLHTFGDKDFAGEYEIPQGTTAIESEAFAGCKSISGILIPQSVTNIGDDAFRSCSSLKTIVLPNGLTTISRGLFLNCTALTQVVLPDGVESIHDYAFYSCGSLASIAIPDSVTSIGACAFWGCDSFTSVVIPDSVASLGTRAFKSCLSLEKIVLSNSITSIDVRTFEDCTTLSSIEIPEGVTSIGAQAFNNCLGLKEANIPQSVTSIGDDAFFGCKSLTIHGYQATGAHQFSVSQNIPFMAADNHLDPGLFGYWAMSSNNMTSTIYFGDDGVYEQSSLRGVYSVDTGKILKISFNSWTRECNYEIAGDTLTMRLPDGATRSYKKRGATTTCWYCENTDSVMHQFFLELWEDGTFTHFIRNDMGLLGRQELRTGAYTIDGETLNLHYTKQEYTTLDRDGYPIIVTKPFTESINYRISQKTLDEMTLESSRFTFRYTAYLDGLDQLLVDAGLRYDEKASGADTAEAAIEGFLEACVAMDYEKAAHLIDPGKISSSYGISMYAAMIALGLGEKPIFNRFEITQLSGGEDQRTATVILSKDNVSQTALVGLQKIEGRWYILENIFEDADLMVND